jgi:hypothetical protein
MGGGSGGGRGRRNALPRGGRSRRRRPAVADLPPSAETNDDDDDGCPPVPHPFPVSSPPPCRWSLLPPPWSPCRPSSCRRRSSLKARRQLAAAVIRPVRSPAHLAFPVTPSALFLEPSTACPEQSKRGLPRAAGEPLLLSPAPIALHPFVSLPHQALLPQGHPFRRTRLTLAHDPLLTRRKTDDGSSPPIRRSPTTTAVTDVAGKTFDFVIAGSVPPAPSLALSRASPSL